MLRLLLVLILLFGRGALGYSAERPNILFIYTDDQSYKTVRCFRGSYPWVKTPNFDRLAANGIRFESAYMGAWCMPSRATLLTGKLPHGIESMRMEGTYPGSTYDPEQTPFWPKVFRQHGYQTAQIGKWHTGTDAGYGRDWDYQAVWNRPKHPSNAGNYYADQIVAINGKEQKVEGYSTDNYTQWACDYIRGEHRDRQKPWYLWLCYGGVHGPSHPAQRHVGAYRAASVSAPADIFPPRPGKPSYLNLTQAWSRAADGTAVMGRNGEKFGDESGKQARTHAAWVQQVNECVLSLDEGIGRVLDTLRESGQLENTLVVLTADQGFSMGEHGFRTKLAPYDANFRSPLIISRPGEIPTGQVCEVPVTSQDLVVTFMQQAGITSPWKMHGRDLTPLLEQPNRTDWNYPALFEHTGHDYGSDVAKIMTANGEMTHSNVPWWFAVRSGSVKYIRNMDEARSEELYDLATDPEELSNLAADPKYTPQLQSMRRHLHAELKRTEATFADLVNSGAK